MIQPVFSLSTRIAIILILSLGAYVLGYLRGTDRESAKHDQYVAKQAAAATTVERRYQQIATKTEQTQRERVRIIYLQGAEIEKQVPVFVPKLDDERFAVSNGWVRIYDAAFSGEATGAASESDREPSELPISAIAEVNAHNATACRQWREQALGWRKFYESFASERQ